MEKIDLGCRFGGHGPLVGGRHLTRRHTLEKIRHELGESLIGSTRPGTGSIGGVCHVGEHLTDVLERLAFQETSQEEISFLPERQLFVQIHLLPSGKEAPSLQFHERGCDQ